jgi:hypothetical protein
MSAGNARPISPTDFWRRPFSDIPRVGDESAKWGKADIGALLAIRDCGARALRHEPAPSSGDGGLERSMKCATLAANHVRTAIYRFEGSAAQNSKFVKYGAGGERVRYRWGTGSVPLPN